MYFVTYILVPMLAGTLAVCGLLVAKRSDARARRVAPYRALIGVSLLVCGVLDLLELLDIVGGLNRTGKALFVGILVSQFGLGFLPALEWTDRYRPGGGEAGAALRNRLVSMEVPLGLLAIATALAMFLVRARIYVTIF
jgi:hypothetical protein